MKLIEMKVVPKKVGDANIAFRQNSHGFPARKEHNIILPADPYMDFFWLSGGTQFLINKNGGCFFGGMDEAPFLVELNTKAYYTLVEKGEDEFYRSLKPEPVKQLEKDLNTPSLRQGDIFSIKLPLSMGQVKAMNNCCGLRIDIAFQRNARFMIFGTRHQIFAQEISSTSISSTMVLAEKAILKAPDHADLELPGVNLLMQSDLLDSPQKAD